MRHAAFAFAACLVLPLLNACDGRRDADRPHLPVAQHALSAAAQLGRKMFFDASLSGSGQMSCASCHDPQHAYAPGNALAVQMGGPDMHQQGLRAVPSLTYRERTPPFSIGPDIRPDGDGAAPAAAIAAASSARPEARAAAKSGAASAVQERVPRGGMDWDGRASKLPDQAGGPLLDPHEMANESPQRLLEKLRAAPYAGTMRQLFGPGVFSTPSIALGEAYFALARFQLEDPSFHRYDSKYDRYLAGAAKLTEQEARGLALFDDPKKGNCAACHPDKPDRKTGAPPVFTDYQFEALAAPRNRAILANADPAYSDLGLCGPLRRDLAAEPRYCGFFKTPGLRNVATRRVFFHNGFFHSLDDVVRFYVERETRPQHFYPRGGDEGRVMRYNDLPLAVRGNVDTVDAPFDRAIGDPPALTPAEIADVVAFLKILNDGYGTGY